MSADIVPYMKLFVQESMTMSLKSKSDPYVSKVWVSDNGDGTYKNPVLYADYSDPDVVRAGEDYYMTASSFTCFPGLPILHSKDLVNWAIIGHALPRYPDAAFDRPQHGKGVWAPAIRYHNEHFYIYWGDPDRGIYRVKSKDPQGHWDEPVLVLAGKGLIDPCPFWDEDGSAYLVHGWAGSRTGGFNSILTIRRMNSEGACVIDQGKHVFDGHEKHPTMEGPKFYKRNGYYYIFAPAGGVPQGWQTVLRSKDIYGPYEDKIVLDQGSTIINGPHQGAWVDTLSGQDWFVHFQDLESYGRVIHLQPVNWIDDWPVIGVDEDGDGKGEPVLTYQKPDVKGSLPIVTPAEHDEFNSDTLGLQWQWQANPQLTWYIMLRNTDFLRLFAEKLPEENSTLWDAGNLLLQKFPAPDFTATTKVKFTPEFDGKRCGLIIMGSDYSCLSIVQKQNRMTLAQISCAKANKGGSEKVIEEKSIESVVYLRVSVCGPDGLCHFSYSVDGEIYTPIGKSFQSKPGGWIGAKVGLFCISDNTAKNGGYADFNWFRIE